MVRLTRPEDVRPSAPAPAPDGATAAAWRERLAAVDDLYAQLTARCLEARARVAAGLDQDPAP